MGRERRRRGRLRGRLRRGQSLAGQAQAKPPFPVSLLFNVRAFYIVALVIMVTAVAAGAIMSGNIGRSSPPTPTPPPAEDEAEVPPEGEPRQVMTYDAEPEMTIDPSKQYTAVIRTEKGPIRIQLFADKAPRAVNSFVRLARDGFYDGLTFFRLVPDFVAQAGDPTCTQEPGVTCTGTGGPGYTLPLEENDLTHGAGAVAMAAVGEEISGSQFYITYTEKSYLDGRDSVFGKVVEGMDVVESLTPRQWDDLTAPPGDKILWVTIDEA